MYFMRRESEITSRLHNKERQKEIVEKFKNKSDMLEHIDDAKGAVR